MAIHTQSLIWRTAKTGLTPPRPQHAKGDGGLFFDIPALSAHRILALEVERRSLWKGIEGLAKMKIQTLAFILALSAVTAGCAARNVAVEIPENYKGWVIIRYSAQDCGRGKDDGWFQSVVEVQANGEGCSTRWQGTGNLTAVLFYYVDSSGQRKRRLKESGWGEGGEIWGGANNPARREYYVYVGPEASFKHAPYPSRP